MELWFSENQSENQKISVRVKKVLYSGKSQYQDIAVYDTYEYGTLLALDDVIQVAVKDEYIYHEMITHVALNSHHNPQNVLVVGGGDGGAIREILKHKTVKKVVLAEIDQMVIDISKKYTPSIGRSLDDPRVDIQIGDGIEYVKNHKNEFDIIIVDSTDPIGPAVGLFGEDFYKNIKEALKYDGMFVSQTESPVFFSDFIKEVNRKLKNIFGIVKVYTAVVPTYPGGLWTFSVGSKIYDPSVVYNKDVDYGTKYYTRSLHASSFVLPKFLNDLLEA